MPKTYLTNIQVPSQFPPEQGIGIADGFMPSDAKKLGSWWYNWTCDPVYLSDPTYIPMAFNRYHVDLPQGYGGPLLVLNEPENTNLPVSEAINIVRKLSTKYPEAKLIIGGTGYFGRYWLTDFVKELGGYKPFGWHIHGYIEKSEFWDITYDAIVDWFKYASWLLETDCLYLTEFADANDGSRDDDLLNLVRTCGLFKAWAWFTNRAKGTEPWFPKNWLRNPALMTQDGNLTEIGKKYIGSKDL